MNDIAPVGVRANLPVSPRDRPDELIVRPHWVGKAIETTSPLDIFRGGGAPPTELERRKLDRMLEILDGTVHGREVAAHVRAHPEQIRIWSNAEYDATFPGSGASFNPLRQHLNLPQRILDSPERGATTLLHEGQHSVDARSAWSVAGRGVLTIFGSAWDGVRAAARLDNPISGWVDGIGTRQLETEVNAYRVQAQVAKELGRREYGWNLGQEIDGSVRSDEQIREALALESLYAMGPTRRLLLGAGVGSLAVLGASEGVSTLARAIKPGSYLATHRWPVLAVGAALLGAAVIHDQVDYRRRIASGSLN
jgi:hypothetical protein